VWQLRFAAIGEDLSYMTKGKRRPQPGRERWEKSD